MIRDEKNLSNIYCFGLFFSLAWRCAQRFALGLKVEILEARALVCEANDSFNDSAAEIGAKVDAVADRRLGDDRTAGALSFHIHFLRVWVFDVNVDAVLVLYFVYQMTNGFDANLGARFDDAVRGFDAPRRVLFGQCSAEFGLDERFIWQVDVSGRVNEHGCEAPVDVFGIYLNYRALAETRDATFEHGLNAAIYFDEHFAFDVAQLQCLNKNDNVSRRVGLNDALLCFLQY